MADFGIQTFRPNGSVAIDSTNKAGVFIETLQLDGGQSGSKVYTDIPAGALYFITAQSPYVSWANTVTLGDDGAGHAKITWQKSPYDGSGYITTLRVFARRINSSGFGVALLNADGDYLADMNYPVPQYDKTIAPTNTRPPGHDPLSVSGGGLLWERTYSVTTYPTDNKLMLMNLPDSTSDDLWYSFYPHSSAYNLMTVYVYSPRGYGPTIPLPSIHSYNLGTPVSSGASFGIQCFNANGGLTYDSAAENIAIKDTLQLPSSPRVGTTFDIQYVPTYTLNMPTSCGIVAPFLKEKYYSNFDDENGSIAEYWLSLWQRKGSSFRHMVFLVSGTNGGGASAPYLIQEGSGGAAVIVSDISQVNPPPSVYTI